VQYITPGRRIRSAAAQRIEVPIVNAAKTAPTIDEELSGWIFRPPQDPGTPHADLLKYIEKKRGASRLGILRTPDSTAASEKCPWDRCMQAAGRSWTADVSVETLDGGWEEGLEALRSADLDAIFTWANVPTSVALLRRLRAAGTDQLFVGSDSIVCREFVERAGSDPGPVVAAYTPISHGGHTDAESFARQVEERFKRRPGPDAYNSFRATLWLLAGIELGGTGPAGIRDALRALSHGGVARLEGDRWQYEPLGCTTP
jgi:ABC-type branched-subunit amino acid transport system substrate-binding protein